MIYKYLILILFTALLFLVSCESETSHSHDMIAMEDVYSFDNDGALVTDEKILDMVKTLEIDDGTVTTKVFNYPDGTSVEKWS